MNFCIVGENTAAVLLCQRTAEPKTAAREQQWKGSAAARVAVRGRRGSAEARSPRGSGSAAQVGGGERCASRQRRRLV